VVLFLQNGRNSVAVAYGEGLTLFPGYQDFHAAVHHHRPRVEFFSVAQHFRPGFVDGHDPHGRTQFPSHSQRHVGEGLQVLDELQQHLDFIFGAVFSSFETVADPIPDCQTLRENLIKQGVDVLILRLTSMLSPRSSSSSLSTMLSTNPVKSMSSPSSSEWFEAIVSEPL
jgi:hypothetical protein